MSYPVPTERDYLDAAQAAHDAELASVGHSVPVEEFARDSTLRAAVNSAFAAGLRRYAPGEIVMEGASFGLRWCPWHDMLDRDGDDCYLRHDQELWPVRVVTLVVREAPDGR